MNILRVLIKTYKSGIFSVVMQRWGKIPLNKNPIVNIKVPKEVVRAMETLEKALIQETNDINKQIQQLEDLKQLIKGKEEAPVRASLETSFQDKSPSAEASDSKTHIQCIVDRIVEFTNSRKFYQLSEAIDDVISKIEIHQNEFPEEILGNKVFEDIENGLNTHTQSIEIIRDTIVGLEKITSISSESNHQQIKAWAEKLERLGEELEDNIEFLPSDFFDILEKICEAIILKARQKAVSTIDANQRKREEWRRRVRYAAGFILNLIEIAREEAIQEDEEIICDFFAASQSSFNNIYEDEGES